MTTELLLLIWVFIDSNRKFHAYLCQSPSVLIVLQAIIHESLDAKQDASKLGTLRMSCFILQVLSQDRNFGIQLNTSADVSILGSHAKHLNMFSYGCWADIVYLFIFVMLSANPITKASIIQLQESYLATMANIAPLVTKFSAATANKLLTLFNVFSSPRFLLSKERNHSKLFYFLYTIDTILQYQYAGNAQIVYTFVRNKEKIFSLRDLTLSTCIDQVQKIQGETNSEPGSPVPVPKSVLSEKAKGKLPLNSTLFQSSSGFIPNEPWVCSLFI